MNRFHDVLAFPLKSTRPWFGGAQPLPRTPRRQEHGAPPGSDASKRQKPITPPRKAVGAFEWNTAPPGPRSLGSTGASRERAPTPRRTRSNPGPTWPLFILGFVLSTLLILGCKSGAPKPTEGPPGTPEVATPTRTLKFDPAALQRLGVVVAPVTGTEAGFWIHVPGSLEYNLEHYAEIGTIVPGRVSAVMARVGDHVRKGQRLVSMLVPQVADAQAEYLSAQAAALAAKEHAAREGSLLEKQLTTAYEAQTAQSSATRTSASLAAAAARLTAMGVPLPNADSKVDHTGTVWLSSPIDGIVVRRDAVLGAFLEPNTKAFVVADPSELWATVDVYESDVAFFHVGADVELRFDALPGTVVHGKVALMEPQIGSSSRALRARIAVPNPQGQLRSGLFVRASLRVNTTAKAGDIMLPSAAVQPLGDSDVVFVETAPGRFEVRPVQVARRTSQFVQVMGGLQPTERVAIEGTFLLRGEVTKQ